MDYVVARELDAKPDEDSEDEELQSESASDDDEPDVHHAIAAKPFPYSVDTYPPRTSESSAPRPARICAGTALLPPEHELFDHVLQARPERLLLDDLVAGLPLESGQLSELIFPCQCRAFYRSQCVALG